MIFMIFFGFVGKWVKREVCNLLLYVYIKVNECIVCGILIILVYYKSMIFKGF